VGNSCQSEPREKREKKPPWRKIWAENHWLEIPICQDPDGSDMKRIMKKRDLRGIRDKSTKLLKIVLR
jgi:hypothetical protein